MNASPDFLKFISCLGLPITSQNLAFFTDLYVNFTQFYVEPQDSFEMKYIKWKRYYDASSFPLPTHELLETTPSKDFDYVDAINTQANIQQPLLSDVSPPQHQPPCKISSAPPLSPTTTPPPTSPPQLMQTNVQLPHELVSIQNTQNCYQNFTLKNEKQAQPLDNMVEHIEVMATSLTTTPSKLFTRKEKTLRN
jgi:hypothetical protein